MRVKMWFGSNHFPGLNLSLSFLKTNLLLDRSSDRMCSFHHSIILNIRRYGKHCSSHFFNTVTQHPPRGTASKVMRILYLIRLSLPKQTRFGKMSCVDGPMEACLIDGSQNCPRPVRQVPRSGDLVIATHFRWRSWCGWLSWWFGKILNSQVEVSVSWFLKSRVLEPSNASLWLYILPEILIEYIDLRTSLYGGRTRH